MLYRVLLAVVSAIPAFLLSGCDVAGRVSFRFEVRDEGSHDPVPGAVVRMFWFDEPADVLGVGPIEERALEVGEERRHGPGSGLIQKEWLEGRTGGDGASELNATTFYAGAMPLFVRGLVFGRREMDPTGLWLRVRRDESPAAPTMDFVVLQGDEGPVLVRVGDPEGRPVAGETVGSVERVETREWPPFRWRIVLPIER